MIDWEEQQSVPKLSDNKPNYAGRIWKDDARLLFEPFVYPSTQIKTIGFRWAQDGSDSWENHLSLTALEQVQEMFPDHIIDSSVVEWLEELEQPAQLSQEIQSSDLLQFQKEAVGFMLKTNRGLLGLAPGLGKTPISILAIKELDGRTLIICPLPLLYNWKREIAKWAEEDAEIWHGDIGRDEQLWVITNYETALGHLVKYDTKKKKQSNGKVKKTKVNWRPTEQFEFDNVIIDESVFIKNRKAQRSKAVYTLTNKLRQVKNVYLLSGSPITKFLDDMWFQFHTLDRNRFSSYWSFAKEYCIIEENFWGVKIASNQHDAMQRLKYQNRDIYFARTQDQVLNLPDWIFDTFEIPMDPQQGILYREMQDNFITTLPEGDKIVAPNILSQMTRLIQFASNPLLVGGPDLHPKWSTVVDLLEFEELPAIIWTNFVATAEALYRMLEKKFRVRLLIGKTPKMARDDYVQDFQKGLVDVMIAHPAVGKFGLTLTAARTAIYVERSYNGDDYYQSLHRVRRFGTEHSPHVIILLSIDTQNKDGIPAINPTIDHVIHKVLGFKRDNSIQITTGVIREVLGETTGQKIIPYEYSNIS